jgi:phage-related protein
MASISVGSVSVDVVPSVRDFASRIRREILPDADRIGREVGERMARAINAQLDDIKIKVDMGRALARLTQLKKALDELDGRKIDVQVNVDMIGAVAELRTLAQILSRLDGRTINIRLNADVARALAQLAALNGAVRSIDNSRTVNIDVDTGGAMGSINSLRTALIGLGLLASPAIAGIGAGIIGLVGPLTAAGVGFGALAAAAVPSIMRVSEAIKAQETAQKQASATAAQAQSRAYAVAGAQQQVAAAVRSAGYAHQQALDQVRQAEQQLASAQQSALSAQRDLNAARAEAIRQLQDLANDVASARLAERQATFDLADAEEELARIKGNPKADKDQIARAQLAADQARQRLKEQQLRTQRLVADEKRAKKAGVEGSEAVLGARERLRAANQRITDSERELAAARANVARVDQQSADAVASARRALAQASMQGAAANAALAYSLAQLSPLERQLMEGWQGLTGAFREWQKSLQPDVIPVLLQGIGLLRGALPALTPIVRASAQAVGGLLSEMSAASASPFWSQFDDFLAKSAGPAITGLGHLAGSLVTAFAGLAQSFAPIGFAFLQVLNTLAARFAAFATGLANSPGFQAFVNSFVQAAPLITQTLSSLGSLIGSLFAALVPAMQPVLGLINTLASTLGGVLRQVAPSIAAVFGALGPALSAVLAVLGPVVAQLVQALAPLLVQLITGLQPILIALVPVISQVITALAPVISALLSGLQPAIASLVPLVGVLVGAIGRILLALAPILPVLGRFIANLVTGLMPVLTPIIDLIAQTAAQMGGVLVQALTASLPSLQQIVLAVAQLLPALTPLVPLFGQWLAAVAPLLPVVVQLAAVLIGYLVPPLRLIIQVAVKIVTTIAGLLIPIFRFLVGIVTWVAGLIAPLLSGIGAVMRGIGAAAMWLWQNAIAPAFNAIATIAKWLYSAVVVVALAPLIIAFKLVSAVVMWLWRSVIAPAFRAIGQVIKVVWNAVIRPQLNALVAIFRNVIAPAFRWIYGTIIKPLWDKVGAAIRWVFNTFIKPTFDKLKSAVGSVAGAFRTAIDAIKKVWDKLKDVAKKPVAFVVNTVFNGGILKIWNAVADLVPGVKKLEPIRGFASGGIHPGYTPGRDIGLAAVSGGEAIMRPEWTRAVGPGFVHAANAAARRGGVSGVADFMGGHGFAGNYFLGGVVGKFKEAAKGLFAGGLKKAAQKAFGPLLGLADRTLGGMGGFGKLVAAIPHALVSKIMGFFAKIAPKIGGDAKGVIAAARKYIGVGDDRGMDNNNTFTRDYGWPAGTPWCALFVSKAIQDAQAGKFYPGTPTAAVAQFNARMNHVPVGQGRPGDLATYGSNSHINLIEAKVAGGYRTIGGNEGPKVRRSVRGGQATVLRPGFALGGVVDPQVFGQLNLDPRDRTAPLTTMYRELARGTVAFDSGGFLPTGSSLVYNGTGRPEPVFTDAQWRAISDGAAGGDGSDHFHIHMDGLTTATIESKVRSGLQAAQVQAGRKDRTGRRR